jgi:SAM-dependent methyltransferase
VIAEWFTTFARDLWLRDDDTGGPEAAFIKRALKLRKGQRVLDCPCGAGRIALPLAEMGCRVTGVDREAAFIGRIRRRFTMRGLGGRTRARFFVMDMREIDFDGEFDGAINYFGSFGYFDDASNAEFLGRLARAVRPGGRVLIDQVNRLRLMKEFLPRLETPKKISLNRWDAERQRVVSKWKLRGRSGVSRSSMRIYTLAQMRAIMERYGLGVEAVYGGADGSDYGRDSPRMVVVGRKM